MLYGYIYIATATGNDYHSLTGETSEHDLYLLWITWEAYVQKLRIDDIHKAESINLGVAEKILSASPKESAKEGCRREEKNENGEEWNIVHCSKLQRFAPDFHFSSWNETITSSSNLIWWLPTCHWVLHCSIIICFPVPLYVLDRYKNWVTQGILRSLVFFFKSRLCICSCCASLSFSCFSPSQAFFPFSLPCSLIHLNHILSPRSYLASQVFFLCCFLTAVPVCLPAPVRFSLPISVILTFCVADKAIWVTFSSNDRHACMKGGVCKHCLILPRCHNKNHSDIIRLVGSLTRVYFL